MIASRVLETIRRHALVAPGGRVVVALSGGSDSVALLRVLKELEGRGELVVAAAVHLNHGLRAEAHGDEQFCRELAADIGVPFRADLIDVRGRAARERISLESAGRNARYELFERVADEFGPAVIATGHTRNDQAETFLLRLLRGAGPRGLGGIHPRAGRVIRPLIDLDRGDLREYLSSLSQAFREDETNADMTIPRNRIRHELLPLLESRYAPGIVDVLARDASIARADEDHLRREAIDLTDSIVLPGRPDAGASGETVEIDAVALERLHPAIGSRVGLQLLERIAPGRFFSFDHVQRLLALAAPGGRAAVDLPGCRAERRGDVILLGQPPAGPFQNSFQVSLSIPGEVVVAGWAVSAVPCDDESWLTRQPAPGTVTSASPRISALERTDGLAATVQGMTLPLTVRSRQRGDRVKPLGMGGRSKKLQDLLVDRKIARERRDRLPLVVDARDRIVWVVGHVVAEDFRVTSPSQGVILLKARRLGGQG
jgi:tRNA(Ile)-lysidine synthase